MDCKQVPLDLPSLCLPLKQVRRSLRLRIHINSDLVEVLQQPNDEERHLVAGELRIASDVRGQCAKLMGNWTEAIHIDQGKSLDPR